jgi:hypothetical protein
MTSSQLGNAILNDGGAVTVTTDTTIASPFGGSDGVLKCVHTTQTPGYFRRGQNMSLTAGVTYTFSFYFKNGTVSNPYGQNPVNNLGILASTYSPTFEEPSQSLNTNIDVGNGWYRQVFTFTPTYTQTYQVDFSQTVNQTPIGTYYLYGFQLERGSSVTDYYATTSTAKNRGTIWSDLSGRGNTGTLTNGVGYGNSNSGSFVFDGVDDFIDLGNPSSLDITQSITHILWIYPISNIFSGFNGIFTKANSGSSGGTLSNTLIFIAPGQFGYSANSYNVAYGKSDGAGGNNVWDIIPSYNQWYCYSSTYDGSNVILYRNGVEVSRTAQTGTIYNTNQNTGVKLGRDGRYSFDTGRQYNGNIAQVSIYNRALSASEIQQNFNALRGRFGI